jgi:hypothetical protein
MIVMKSISPRRFNNEAFKQVIEAEVNRVADDIQKDFEATTATWKHKPEFEKVVSFEPSPVEVMVSTDDPIYAYVDKGTREHYIFPVKAKALAFPSGYKAKTTPDVLGSQAGGSFGPTVFSMGVLHPGTEARNFDKMIQKKWDKAFKTRMEKAMREAAKASGHGL